MRLKHNPWISLLAALVMTVIVLLYFTGCSAHAETAENGKAQARFTTECDGPQVGVGTYYTITDTETGAQYLLVKNSYGMAMAELEG